MDKDPYESFHRLPAWAQNFVVVFVTLFLTGLGLGFLIVLGWAWKLARHVWGW